MLDKRTAGLPSIGFLDADTDCLGSDLTLDERYHDPNDKGSITYRERGATLRLGGAPLVTQYWGAQNTFSSLTLYHFKNIGEGARAPPTPRPPTPWSLTYRYLLREKLL